MGGLTAVQLSKIEKELVDVKRGLIEKIPKPILNSDCSRHIHIKRVENHRRFVENYMVFEKTAKFALQEVENETQESRKYVSSRYPLGKFLSGLKTVRVCSDIDKMNINNKKVSQHEKLIQSYMDTDKSLQCSKDSTSKRELPYLALQTVSNTKSSFAMRSRDQALSSGNKGMFV